MRLWEAVTVTMAISTKTLPKTGLGGGPKPGRPSGNGSPHGNGHSFTPRFSASRYRIGMWLAMAAILMMFTALSSAYIVRAASSNDWRPLAMPRILLLSTALILLSSVSLEIARRKLKSALDSSPKLWFCVSASLGIGFLVSQLLAWRQLVRQGIYVATNPHSSFFYLLTAVHGVHLLGGLIALLYLAVRARPPQKNSVAVVKGQAAADVVTLYWHFMDVLWIYVFFLLFFWR
jgi:cytochrome c oxidase subunit 3